MVRLTINDRQHSVKAEPDTPPFFALRDTTGLTGTEYGCSIDRCGARTDPVGGRAPRSGQVASESAGARAMTTSEAMGTAPVGTRVVVAGIGIEVSPCGESFADEIAAAMTRVGIAGRDPRRLAG